MCPVFWVHIIFVCFFYAYGFDTIFIFAIFSNFTFDNVFAFVMITKSDFIAIDNEK